jgi:hypothetical protein
VLVLELTGTAPGNLAVLASLNPVALYLLQGLLLFFLSTLVFVKLKVIGAMVPNLTNLGPICLNLVPTVFVTCPDLDQP